MRTILRAAVAALACASAGVANAGEYRWLNSWDQTNLQIPELAMPWVKAIETSSGGKIKINVSGPEAVPPFDQLQPVAAGAFQFLFTHGAYHFGTTPMLATVEAMGGTPKARRESGVFELVDKHYNKHGLKLLALTQTSLPGYQILLRKPLPASGDLQGFKIRGNPTYLSVINMLGASMVTLPIPEVFTSMEKGVIDGFAFPTYGVMSTRLNEVSKYLLRPAMGFGTNPLLVNLAAWNRMPADEQKIFLDEGLKAEERWTKRVDELILEEEKQLVAKGLEIVQMGAASKAKMQSAWSEGLLKLAEPKIPQEVAELRKIMKDKGLE